MRHDFVFDFEGFGGILPQKLVGFINVGGIKKHLKQYFRPSKNKI